jgi:hypothetical protein
MPGLKYNQKRNRLLAELTDPPLFEQATFKAFLNRSTMKFLPSGDLSVSFLIPAEDVASALSLHALCVNPMPLTLTVKVDDDFAADLSRVPPLYPYPDA